jgi:hypothetical protein
VIKGDREDKNPTTQADWVKRSTGKEIFTCSALRNIGTESKIFLAGTSRRGNEVKDQNLQILEQSIIIFIYRILCIFPPPYTESKLRLCFLSIFISVQKPFKK